MKSKTRFKLREKLVFGLFMQYLPDFLEIWHMNAPEMSFDEFMKKSVCEETPQEWKKSKKLLFGAFRGVVLKVMEIWRECESNLPFDEFLKGVAERHEQIISKKSKKEVAQ